MELYYKPKFMRLPLVKTCGDAVLVYLLEKRFEKSPKGFVQPVYISQEIPSLQDLLGFTKKQLNGSITRLCKVLNSKQSAIDVSISTDMFDGKFYLLYYDRTKYGTTIAKFKRNPMLDNLIKDLDG